MIVPESETYGSTVQLKEWIDKLVQAESSGQADAHVESDWNEKPSTGCLQFQVTTWLEQGNKYNILTTPDNLFDCDMQKELAYRMIIDKHSNWKHWRCSTVGVNLEEQLGMDTFCKVNFEKRGIHKLGIGLPPMV